MGEFDLIAGITDGLELGEPVLLGPGDDAAVLRAGGDVVVSTDMLVEEVDFRRAWSEPHHVGRKAVAVNVSDIEAMGATPTAVVIALAFPRDLDPAWLRGFSAGVKEECARAGVSLVGGDLSGAPSITVCGTALGNVTTPVTRSGARPGDVVAVCGNLGISAAGLLTLQRGFRSPLAAINEHRCPSVPYGQGRVAAAAGATAMMDVSDGLLQDLGHICAASGVSVDVWADAVAVPEVVERIAQATGRSARALVLAGGEDHSLVATFPDGDRVPEGWFPVGCIGEGAGVTVDGQPWDDDAGWDHFR